MRGYSIYCPFCMHGVATADRRALHGALFATDTFRATDLHVWRQRGSRIRIVVGAMNAGTSGQVS